MARWSLEYYIGTPYKPRSVEAQFDDLLGERIAQAHELVREHSDGAGTLSRAVLLVDEGLDSDPVPGEPMITQWITYIPYDPDDDPDADSSEQPRREAIAMPARLFETSIDPQGVLRQAGPAIGHMLRALRLHLGDGREATILRVESAESPV
ncbi:hypothetical protein [Streptomyces antibioticus]|uniref:hypothetical protein n=1 Tax=Streptomyces antibioticus TaxID=1890 RepID=UPI003681A4F7